MLGNAQEIGANRRKLRGDRPQKEVAEAVGVSVMAISSYERGDRVPLDNIKIKLADYFGTTVQDIFFGP
jgi:DNA-binding XRE family transcriptional regulator